MYWTIGIVACVIAMCIVMGYRRVQTLKKKIRKQRSAIKKNVAMEKNLRDQLTLSQNKLHETTEDPITHLTSWQIFHDQLNRAMDFCNRNESHLAILFIEIEDFSTIIHVLGNEVRNQLLINIAEQLQACIRQVDFITRFHEHIFVVVLTQLNKPETAMVVAQRMLQAFNQPIVINEHELFITAGIGIAVYPQDANDSETLLRNAEHALTLAKEKGKHNYHFYQKEMQEYSNRELIFNNLLNNESIFQELIFYYQPIVDVVNESILCMEVQLCWQSKEFGLIDAKEVASYSERQHKINLLYEWLIKNACKQFLHWRSLGFSPELLGIQVTVQQLENSHFIYRISQLLQELSFKPEWLLLEIKNGSAESIEQLEKPFNMLHYLGINIAMDHFAGPSFSLSHLRYVQVDYLKLDPVFIEDIVINHKTLALVEAMIFLAKTMPINLVIQNVETKEQAALLRELGCVYMQGQWLGMPVPEKEVMDKMAIT